MTGGQLDLIDGPRLAAVAERRAALARAAGVVMTAVRRDNTKRAFEDDWRAWSEFCEGMAGQVDPTDPNPHSLVLYAVWLAQGGTWLDGRDRKTAAPSTITRRMTGVLYGWRQAGRDFPRGITSDARKVVDEYTRNLVEAKQPTGRGQARPLEIRELRLIARATPQDLEGLRDMAALAVGFGIAGRRSEVAHLTVADIEDDPNGILVDVRFSKTKPRRPAVKRFDDETICPVRCWQRWRDASAIVTGPAFRRVRHDRVWGDGLSGEALSELLVRACRRASIPSRTWHAVRAGLATESRRAGHDAVTIAAQGGWDANSSALYGYMRIVDQWTDNATAGLG